MSMQRYNYRSRKNLENLLFAPILVILSFFSHGTAAMMLCAMSPVILRCIYHSLWYCFGGIELEEGVIRQTFMGIVVNRLAFTPDFEVHESELFNMKTWEFGGPSGRVKLSPYIDRIDDLVTELRRKCPNYTSQWRPFSFRGSGKELES